MNLYAELGKAFSTESGGTIQYLISSREPTREAATYICPWEKTGLGRYTPTLANVCPCDLLIVMAKAGRIGNWVRINSNGRAVSDGERQYLGKKKKGRP